jgi:eukaryotic-like serine/threonine-protein kinase
VQDSSSTLSNPAHLPRKLGRYELVRLLGEDSVAETFLARPLGANNRRRWLGLKLAHAQLANDDGFRRAFLYQARIGVALRHPNVVRTYEVVAEPGQCYAVTEFLRGRVLSRLTDERAVPLPLELHIGILLQILEGLRYIHELGSKEGKWLALVHRNLSPSRVFVGYDGRVRILDSGLARVHAIASVRRDNPNTVMRYSAPEQCLGRRVDSRSDLYAVGVMLWEAMVGQPRQFSKTLAEALDARVRNREPSIEHILPGAPPFLAAICQRALAWSPEERYASAAEFYRDLSRYVTTTGQHVGQDALSRTLHASYASDIAGVEQLLDDAQPSALSASRGTLTGALPVSPAHPVSAAHDLPPPSSEAPLGSAGGRKHWGFRTPGPSVMPIVPERVGALGRLPSWPKLLSGAALGTIAGLVIGVLLKPAASDDASLGERPAVVAPLMPQSALHAASPKTEAEALVEAEAQPAADAPPAAEPASAAPQAAPAASGANEPASAVPIAKRNDAPEPSPFVVKTPEPPPVDAVDEPFVVKQAEGEEEAEALAEAEASARRRAAAKRRKRAAEASQLAQDVANRAPRPIDETDPYAEQASPGARERGAR